MIYYFVLLKIRDKSRDGGKGRWRKPVGVEPTNDTRYRSPGLKPGPNTGQDWLPFAIVAGGDVRAETYLSCQSQKQILPTTQVRCYAERAFDRSAI